MTIENIKKAYGDDDDAYVSCADCPVHGTGKCTHDLDGYDECYSKILDFLHGDNDPVNHPSHYTNGGMECIDEMILIFGIEYTMHFCLLNAWKYRRRALDKNGQQDMDKSHWYINKYKELKEKLDELHREQTIHF